MRFLRVPFRHGRSLAGLALLAALVAGDVVDTRHHLTDHGCAADTHENGRDERCACAALHAAPLAGDAPVAFTPVATGQAPAPAFALASARRHGVADAAPRAPPRG
jgi:hypothetical protein